MQLIFLNEQDLSVIDYGYATDDFDIILDALVPQKSKFTVNKLSLNAKVGDLLLVKEKLKVIVCSNDESTSAFVALVSKEA